MSPEVHPHHVAYATLVPDPDLNTLSRLFSLLDGLDPYDRHRMLNFVRMGLRVHPSTDEKLSEEQMQAVEYEQFKQCCRNLPIAEYFAVHAVVTHTLGWLLQFADEALTGRSVQRLQRLLADLQSGVALAELTTSEREHSKMTLEEHINNAQADAELWRRRYVTFCETVVRGLLQAA